MRAKDILHLAAAAALLSASAVGAGGPDAGRPDAGRPDTDTSGGTEEAKKGPPVVVAKVEVTPTDPAPDTLMKLTVELANSGAKTASLFAFEVEVGGHKLPVYDRELFALAVAAGGEAELPLYNFWSTETGRPAPAGGQLEVKVSLVEAEWVEITDEDGVEVWTPAGAVEGLPSTASVRLEMKR